MSKLYHPVSVEEWTKALRSGEYKQSRSVLHCDAGFCCLGVLAHISKVPRKPYQPTARHSYPGTQEYNFGDIKLYGIIPDRWSVELGLTASDISNLIRKNDAGVPFNEIADMIEDMVKKNQEQ